MLLEKLVIENYGIYADRSELDLSTSPEKPIILIGGLNGAGKTTIFESIMVALYGKTYLGAKTAKKQYLEFIADKIHRYKNGRRAKHAFVEVSFRFYHNGSEDIYVINRGWDTEGASVSETLQIRKNGEPMDDIDESLWQSFIEGLIPIGIARLFFFDGEKIVRVTKWDEGDNEEIKTSMDILLGTELINRLDADLDLYTVRKSGSKTQDTSIRAEYEGLLKEKRELAFEIDTIDAEISRKKTDLVDLESKISARELKIAGIGGGYADMRSNLFTQKAVLEEKIRHIGKQIQEELANDAPLYMASDILAGIHEQIRSDVEIMQQKSSISYVQQKVESLKDDLSSEEFGFADPVNDAMCKKIYERLDDMIKKPTKGEFFDMSPNDAEWMQQKIGGVMEGSNTLRANLDEYGKTNTRLAKTESDLAKIPQDDEIGPRISEINNMHQEVGMLKAEIENMMQAVSSKHAYQKILQSKLKGLIDTLHRSKTFGAGVELAAKMKKALASYHKSLRERKMRELETHLLNTVRILLHKDLISKIEVDQNTFEIRVYGSDEEDPIPGGLLSMGERQMVGTALLWAIARTCGRSLPFVIDTPLGRLDGEHLSNLIDRFYPFVSHQIVLLSTDREIGQKEYAQLSEYVTRSYLISYDHKEVATSIRNGYFVEEEKSIA